MTSAASHHPAASRAQHVVAVAVGADDGHGGQRGRRPGAQQHRHAQELAEAHQSASSTAVTPVDAVDGEVGALDDRRRPLVGPDADADGGVQQPLGLHGPERLEGVEVGGVVARVQGGRRAGALAQRAHRLALVDRHGRADLQHLAPPVGGAARPTRPPRRGPRAGCARRPRRACRASGRRRSGPCPPSGPAAPAAPACRCSAANSRTRPSQLAKAGTVVALAAPGSSSSAPWEPA